MQVHFIPSNIPPLEFLFLFRTVSNLKIQSPSKTEIFIDRICRFHIVPLLFKFIEYFTWRTIARLTNISEFLPALKHKKEKEIRIQKSIFACKELILEERIFLRYDKYFYSVKFRWYTRKVRNDTLGPCEKRKRKEESLLR